MYAIEDIALARLVGMNYSIARTDEYDTDRYSDAELISFVVRGVS